MELLLGLIWFIVTQRFLRRTLELPPAWALWLSLLATLVLYPAVVQFVTCSLAAITAGLTALFRGSPLVPILIVLILGAGTLLARRLRSRLPRW